MDDRRRRSDEIEKGSKIGGGGKHEAERNPLLTTTLEADKRVLLAAAHALKIDTPGATCSRDESQYWLKPGQQTLNAKVSPRPHPEG